MLVQKILKAMPARARVFPFLIESVEEKIVIPAKAGIDILRSSEIMDSRLRGNDRLVFDGSIKSGNTLS